MTRKPLIVYIDDEPRNLAVFEALMPDEWEIKTFDSAVDALKTLKALDPWVIISDQRMPNMTGLELLEVAQQLLPDAIRIVVTGQTDESTIIQLIRRAKIFDYITKPWDTDMLLSQLEKAVDFYRLSKEREQAISMLEGKNSELEKKNTELHRVTGELAQSKENEVQLRNEIAAWVPISLVNAITNGTIKSSQARDIVGITYDIVNSSKFSAVEIGGRSVRSYVLHMFTEALIRHGGVRESSSGDSVYGHFGAFVPVQDPCLLAMTVAQEFRVALRGFSKVNNLQLECGISIHFAPRTLVQVHEVHADGAQGKSVQKSFDTNSAEIDLLFRMERIAHELPGSNVILSQAVIDRLTEKHPRIFEIGEVLLKGQKAPSRIFILISDQVAPETLEVLKEKYALGYKKAA